VSFGCGKIGSVRGERLRTLKVRGIAVLVFRFFIAPWRKDALRGFFLLTSMFPHVKSARDVIVSLVSAFAISYTFHSFLLNTGLTFSGLFVRL
jgi:hypothetical protein